MMAAASGMKVFRKVARLPARARALVALLLFSATLPALAMLVGAILEPGPGATLFENRPIFMIIAGCVAVAGALAFESPRSASPLAYARQLRARLLEIQSMYDADDRRRPGEGKEKEDDRVPSDP